MTLARTLNAFMGSSRKAGSRPRRGAKSLDALRANPRVWFVDREDTDGWFITFRPGWKSASDPLVPTHCFGATTLTEAKKEVAAALPCACEQCRGANTDD